MLCFQKTQHLFYNILKSNISQKNSQNLFVKDIKDVNLCESSCLLKSSWENDVKSETIINSWNKADLNGNNNKSEIRQENKKDSIDNLNYIENK